MSKDKDLNDPIWWRMNSPADSDFVSGNGAVFYRNVKENSYEYTVPTNMSYRWVRGSGKPGFKLIPRPSNEPLLRADFWETYAPDGAEEAGYNCAGEIVWYKNIDNQSYEFYYVEPVWVKHPGRPRCKIRCKRPVANDVYSHELFIPPIQHKLPAAGTMCEARHGLGWVTAVIIAHDTSSGVTYAVYRKIGAGAGAYGGYSDPDMFRPIQKTARERAVDEAVKVFGDNPETRANLGSLYDHGLLREKP